MANHCLKEGDTAFVVSEVRCIEPGISSSSTIYKDELHLTFSSAAGVLDRLQKVFGISCGPEAVDRTEEGELKLFRSLSEQKPTHYTKFEAKPLSCVDLSNRESDS